MSHLRIFVDSKFYSLSFFPVASSVIFLLVYAKCNFDGQNSQRNGGVISVVVVCAPVTLGVGRARKRAGANVLGCCRTFQKGHKLF